MQTGSSLLVNWVCFILGTKGKNQSFFQSQKLVNLQNKKSHLYRNWFPNDFKKIDKITETNCNNYNYQYSTGNDSEFFNEDSKSLSDISQKKDGSSTGKESKIFELEDKNSDNNILASSMHINKLSQKRTSSRQSSFHLSNLSSSKDSNYRRVSRNWQSNKVSYFL